MRHTIQIEGFGIRLRPVRMADAPFIVWVRNLDHAKGRLGDSATDVPGQEAWLKEYFHRPGDYYFIIETLGGIPLGAHGLYDVAGRSAESGRWVIRPDVPAALPSTMRAFDFAFGPLGLRELRVRTVSTNRLVLSLNRKLGFQETGIEYGARVIGGRPVDLVAFILGADDWRLARRRLLPLAAVAEKQVRLWEREQVAKGGAKVAVEEALCL